MVQNSYDSQPAGRFKMQKSVESKAYLVSQDNTRLANNITKNEHTLHIDVDRRRREADIQSLKAGGNGLSKSSPRGGLQSKKVSVGKVSSNAN